MQQNNSYDWINASVKNHTSKSTSDRTLEWKVKIGIDTAIFITSNIGNLLVLLVIYNKKAVRKTPYEILLSNLSITDILTVWMYFTFTYFSKPASNFSCKFGVSFFTSLVMVSMFVMTTIALFRCRSILHPFKPKLSTKFTYCTTAGLWVLANVFILPAYVVIIYNRDFGFCYEVWPSQTLNKLYTITLFIVQYVIPLTIMAVSYTKIVLYLKQHKIPQSGLNRGKPIQMTLRRKRDMEVIKISVTIVLLYTILTLPGQIAWISVVLFNDYEASVVIFKFSTQLLLLHTCCNPFVYGMISREFRLQIANAVCNIFNYIFKRNRVRTVALCKQQGETNNSFQELDINTVVLTSVQCKRD